jgi:5-methylcytosine-specific restriction endonuclease McrA
VPLRALRPCSAQPCPNLVPSGRCEQHKRKGADAVRPPSHRRGYDPAWRKLRAAYAAEHLRCQHPDCGKPTAEVHHRIPVRVDPGLRLEWSNLVALCALHHRQAEARGARG